MKKSGDILTTWKKTSAFAVALLGLLSPMVASGADVRGYGVFKTQDYLQTSAAPPVLQTAWPAYSFSAIVQPNGLFTNQIFSASVESPLGFVDPLTPPLADSDQPFASYFGAIAQAALDANYPAGVYILRINTAHDGNKVLLLNATNSTATAFPVNAPRISNYDEAQAVDAASNFVLRWDAFTGATTNDSINFSLADENGNVVFRTATFGPEPGLAYLAHTNTSVLIPANTLAPGRTYHGYLLFERDLLVQTTNYPGARGLVGFAKATSFTLKTTGAPVESPWLETLGKSNGMFNLQVHGAAGQTWVIEACTNPAVGNWSAIFTNVGSFAFADPASANLNRRFYRVVQKP